MTNDHKDNGFDNDTSTDVEKDEKSPDFLAARPGRMVSTAGLIERIVEQFEDEYGERGINLRDETETERRKLLRAVTDYITSVESVILERPELVQVLQAAYSEIFGYAGLDRLFEDDSITTIALEGTHKVSVRYQPGTELVALDEIFEDVQQMRRVMERMVQDAGAELRDDIPVLEVGLTARQRPVCLNLVMPPLVIQPTADIRVHPAIPVTPDKLVDDNYMTAETATFLKALVTSEHGFIIVGDTESGKTTLLGALAQLLAEDTALASVERAGELRLPEPAKRHIVKWAVEEDPEISFGDCIENALETEIDCLLLDEVRADEPVSIAPLLNNETVPRQIWSFRGSASPMRIRSALSQLARMAYPAQPEGSVHGLYTRLPFVVIVQRRRGTIRLRGIAEWQFAEDADYPDFVELFHVEDDTLERTGKTPHLTLNLPETFWTT